MSDAARPLSRSRLLARLPLADGTTLVTHVLGRARVRLDPAAARLLHAFDRPSSVAEAAARVGVGTELARTWVEIFRRALLLRAPGNGEMERIRAAYRMSLAAATPWTGGWLEHRRRLHLPELLEGSLAADHPDLAVERSSVLELAPSLAALALGVSGDLLVTHALGPPTHLDAELWSIARSFARRQTVEESGVPLEVCRFLAARHVLRTSHEDELERAHAILPGSSGVRVEFPPTARWRQRFASYCPSMLGALQARGTVALVGPCQVQLVAEALEHLARCAGVALRVEGFLEPEDVPSRAFTLVVCSASQFAAAYYEALAFEDATALAAASADAVARTSDLVARLRARTSASISLWGLSRPSVDMTGPAGAFTSHALTVHARAHAALAAVAERYGDVEVVDLDRAFVGFGGRSWDDELHATPHHSALSSWSWVVLKPGVTDTPYVPTDTEHAPPPDPWQRDPAEPLAHQILDALGRRHAPPIRLIALDPDDLLWPGRATDERSNVAPHAFSDVEEYRFAGLHETLCVLLERGVTLVLLARDVEAARRRLRAPRPTRAILPEGRIAIYGGAPHEALERAVAAAGVSEEHTLWCSLHDAPPAGFRGRRFDGSRWALRKSLLREPAFQARARPVAARPWGLGRVAPPDEVMGFAVGWLADRLRCTQAAVGSCDDFRELGLDSLGGAELMEMLERTSGLAFEASDRTESVVFRRRGLEAAIARAAARLEASPASPPESADLGARILAALSTPRRGDALRVVRSADGTHQELRARGELRLRSAEWAAGWVDAAPMGAIVAIGMSVSAELVCAVVGAILAGRVPLVVPPPARDAIPSWLERHASPAVAVAVAVDAASRGAVARAGARVAEPQHDAAELPRREPPGDATAIALGTSGTTGGGRTVLHTHASILSRIDELSLALSLDPERDRIACATPVSHTIGLVNALLLPLVTGVPATLVDPAVFAVSPESLLAACSEDRATITFLPTFALEHVVRGVAQTRAALHPLHTLRAVVCAGEALRPATLDRFAAHLAAAGLRRDALSSGYGMAELAGAVTQTTPGREPLRFRADEPRLHRDAEMVRADSGASVELVASGEILPSIDVRVVGRDGAPLPDGRIGALEVKSPSIAAALPGAPALDLTNDGFLRTGDLGARIGRQLFVTGRAKELMILAGRNVSPAEVEAVVATVDGVRHDAALAFSVDDPERGTERLEIWLERDTPDEPDAHHRLVAALRARVRRDLAIDVAAVHLGARGAILRTPLGKLARAESVRRVLARLGAGP